MRRTVLLSLVLLLVFGANQITPRAQVPSDERPSPPVWTEPDDPDCPSALGGKMDPKDYLLGRAEQIAQMRGYEPGLPFNPALRMKAVAILEAQKRIQAESLGLPEGVPGPRAPITWTELGPMPIPNGQTNGAAVSVSGRVTAIAIHPTNSSIAYVGTAQGGLYRTLDGGTSWTQLMNSAATQTIGAVTIDPVSPSRVFVGTGEGNESLDSFFGVGLYRIENADTTPTVYGPFETRVAGTGTTATTTHAFYGTAITNIAVDPGNDNRLFISNNGGGSGLSGDWICCGSLSGVLGLYFCSNALSATPTFSLVSVPSFNGIQATTDVTFEPGSSNNLLFAVQDYNASPGLSGVYRTTNASVAPGSAPTFTRTFTPATSVNCKLAINKVGSTVTVLAARDTASGTVLKSTDGGATWPTTLSAVTGFCGGQCWYDIGLALDPTNANNIFVAGNVASSPYRNFAASKDGGSTFSEQSTNLHADSHAIAVAPSSTTTLYTGNDGGIFKGTFNSSTGAVTWSSVNKSAFSATQFQGLALHPTDPNFSLGGTQDNGTNLLTTGPTWKRVDWGDGGFALIDQNATDTTNVVMYHTYYNQTNSQLGYARVDTVTNAKDGSWTFYGCGGTSNGINCSDSVLFYAPMALGPGSPNSVYYGSDRLYRSANKGVTATVASQAPIVASTPISSIAVSPQDDNYRLVGLKNGGLYYTITGSSTLTDLDSGGTIPNKYVGRVFFDPTNKNTAYVCLDGYMGSTSAANSHVWKITNIGTTPVRTAINTGLPDVPVNAFAVDPANPNNLFAGTDIGVYNSHDGGSTWAPYGTGLPSVAIFGLGIQTVKGVVRVATHGRGMWEAPLNSYVPKEDSPAQDLKATKGSGTIVSVTFTNGCDATDNTIYTGSLATLQSSGVSWTARYCNKGITSPVTFDPGNTSIYFVIVGNNGVANGIEGSYGRNSSSVERPAAGAGTCAYTQNLAGTCP